MSCAAEFLFFFLLVNILLNVYNRVSLLNGLQNDLHVLYVECDVKLYSLSQCYFGSADSLVIL